LENIALEKLEDTDKVDMTKDLSTRGKGGRGARGRTRGISRMSTFSAPIQTVEGGDTGSNNSVMDQLMRNQLKRRDTLKAKKEKLNENKESM